MAAFYSPSSMALTLKGHRRCAPMLKNIPDVFYWLPPMALIQSGLLMKVGLYSYLTLLLWEYSPVFIFRIRRYLALK
jgi:hypothetical protein